MSDLFASVDWTLVSGLCSFIVCMLLLRDIHTPRHRDWLRDMYKQGYRPRRTAHPHHTSIRRTAQDDWECGVGRHRIS